MYTTLQPELVKTQAQREESDGQVFTQQHEQHEEDAQRAEEQTRVSRAMAQDFKDAGEQLKTGGSGEGGFAWGIRNALFGKRESENEKREGGAE